MSAPRLTLGVDTLCWHLRIETGDLTVEDVLVEAEQAGAEYVQLCLHHVRERSTGQLGALARRADELGLGLLASGDHLGAARYGEPPSAGTERARTWLERAGALGSPILRVCSGFYRADLAGAPEAIDAERAWMVGALAGAVDDAVAAGVTLAVENHSDFSADEYAAMLAALDGDRVRVFLDLINPISAFEEPAPVVRRLAPLAVAGHIKDYELVSIQTDDAYHRRGFSVVWRYPGEGVVNLPQLLGALAAGLGDRELPISVEGLDNRADIRDQLERVTKSLSLLRGLTDQSVVSSPLDENIASTASDVRKE
jgi:sugar phosphate isomerase/epimerase